MVEAALEARILEEFSGLKSIIDLLTAQEHDLIGGTVDGKYKEKPYTPLAVVDKQLSPERCEEARRQLGFYKSMNVTYWGRYAIDSGSAEFSLPRLDLEEDSDTFGETLWDPRLLNANELRHLEHDEEGPDNTINFPYRRLLMPTEQVKKDVNAARLLTQQEHELYGSTTVNDLYIDNPYTPKAVLDGLLTIEECNELREGRFFVDEMLAPSYFGKDGEGVIQLVRLDKKGLTICDPILLNEDELEDATEFEIDPMPYQRD